MVCPFLIFSSGTVSFLNRGAFVLHSARRGPCTIPLSWRPLQMASTARKNPQHLLGTLT